MPIKVQEEIFSLRKFTPSHAEELLGSPVAFNYFTPFRQAYSRLIAKLRVKSVDYVLGEIKRVVEQNMKRNLNCATGDTMRQMEPRIQEKKK